MQQLKDCNVEKEGTRTQNCIQRLHNHKVLLLLLLVLKYCLLLILINKYCLNITFVFNCFCLNKRIVIVTIIVTMKQA